MKSRAEVIAEVRAKIRVRHFAYSTEQAYCGWVARYYNFCRGLSRPTSREQKAEAFLTHLAIAGRVAAKTQNQALSALLFLYAEVLGTPLGAINGLRAKRATHERTAPSREQIRAFREAVVDRPHTPARLLVDLLYGCGLRVSEPLELRVKEILWAEGQLIIRSAKGAKDRRVPIPRSCIEPLRLQLQAARRVWEYDRLRFPSVGVTLPGQLARKYPSAVTSWQWYWVFPAPGHCHDPRTGVRVRYHLLVDSLQRVVRDAAAAVGLEYVITPHVLRHAYATHSRESIEALRQLMGHASIETTAGYRHAAIEAASNPLDDLAVAARP